MIIPTLDRRNVNYSKCLYSDVDYHYEIIKNAVNDVNKKVFKDRMKKCIETDTAFHIPEKDVFIYLEKRLENIMVGVAFYGKGKPFELLTLMFAICSIENPLLQKVKFKLHKNTTHTDYISILTKGCLINHKKHSDLLIVDLIHFKNKMNDLYIRAGIVWVE